MSLIVCAKEFYAAEQKAMVSGSATVTGAPGGK
jgi:hypothetical protein